MFARNLEQYDEAIALLSATGTPVSYRALAQAADAFSAILGSSRQLLLIEMANALEPLIAYLGALRGGHPVILSSGQNDLLAATFAPNLIYHKVEGAWRLDVQANAPQHDLHPDLAVMLSTSGTTGSAKLVRLSAHNLDANARSIADYLQITPTDRAITSLPLHYSYGLSVLNSHLAAGASVVVGEWALTTAEFVTALESYAVTNVAGVPYSYELLEKSPFYTAQLPALRYCTQAGGKMPVAAVQRWATWARERRLDFVVMYGQTEATARMSYLPPALLATHAGSIGDAIPGGSFYLIDEEGVTIAAAGVVGELVYRGPNVMMGYAESRTDLALPRTTDELRTGDLATRDADGFYTIVGRRKRISKIFGLRVSLDDIEAQLQAAGATAYVTGDDQLLVIATPGPALAPQWIDSLAARYGLPKNIFVSLVLDAIPRLANGKIDYGRILEAGKARVATHAARDARLSPLRQLFAELAHDGVARDHESFTTLGSDSLSYVRASIVVEEQLGHLPDRWEELTLAELEALPRKEQRYGLKWLRWHDIEMTTIVRALAIVAVVCVHLLPHGSYAGGAELLMALAGLNIGKNSLSDLVAGYPFRPLKIFLIRVIVPYFILLAVYFPLHPEKFRFDAFLLIGNLHDVYRGDMLSVYWFLEAFSQVLLLIALLFSIPPLRRFAQQQPQLFGWCLLVASLLLKWIFFPYFGHARGFNRTPDAVLYLIAFGWLYAVLRSRGMQLLLIAVTVIASQLTWGLNDTHPIFLGVGFLLILFVPKLRLPRPISWPLTAISLASMYIYLTHCLVRNALVRIMPDQFVPLRILTTLAIGWAIWWSVSYLSKLWHGMSRPKQTFPNKIVSV